MTIQLDHIAADTVLDPASEAIAAIARGEIVVIVDDEDRENEGDLVAAADHADAGVINFMITHGRGLVCLALPAARAAELELPPMVPHNEDHMGTAFTVSIDGTPARGVTTGISAGERATTIGLALTGTASDLQRPGHIFPLIARDGGVLTRTGHTEASGTSLGWRDARRRVSSSRSSARTVRCFDATPCACSPIDTASS